LLGILVLPVPSTNFPESVKKFVISDL